MITEEKPYPAIFEIHYTEEGNSISQVKWTTGVSTDQEILRELLHGKGYQVLAVMTRRNTPFGLPS